MRSVGGYGKQLVQVRSILPALKFLPFDQSREGQLQCWQNVSNFIYSKRCQYSNRLEFEDFSDGTAITNMWSLVAIQWNRRMLCIGEEWVDTN